MSTIYTRVLRDFSSLSVLIRTKLWAQILVAMCLGLGTGFLLSAEGAALVSEDIAAATAAWLKLPGSIFLNLIQMVVIPLVMSSIVLGICASGDSARLKQVGLRLFPYFVGTTSIAVTIGITLALIINPGSYFDKADVVADTVTVMQGEGSVETIKHSVPDQIAALIPSNVAEAEVTRNMLQIVVFSLFVGAAIIALPKERGLLFIKVADAVQELALKIVSWAMLLAPIAVFGLLADITIRVGVDAIVGVSVYVGTVLAGLLVLLCCYLLIVRVLAGRSIKEFVVAVRDVQLLAFSTSSSAAVMPLSMKIAIERLKVSPAISKFVVPLGATVNMDGTALYQVVAALFLTQVYGVELTMIEIVVLAVTTVGASIGSPSTPGVGIVILATILQGIGIPPGGIALIIGVDRILDMCRTTVNVTGDLTASCVMDRWLPRSHQDSLTASK